METNYNHVFKYIIVGDMGVGKTCLVTRYVHERFPKDAQHTIGVEFNTKILNIGNQKIKLQIWDTAGQERFRAVTRSYYRGAAGVILVYDISRRATFQSLNVWLTDARQHSTPNCTMYLIGNKADMESQRDVMFEEGKSFAEQNNMGFMECSSINGQNIEEVFLEMSTKIHEQINQGKNELSSSDQKVLNKIDSQKLTEKDSQSSGCGC